MARKARVGVVVLFDDDVNTEIDGLRRGLGETDLGRVTPHLTLVPTINVRDVDDAVRVLRAAAGASKPFDLSLGPVGTFLPDNPVAFLRVGGDVDALLALREGAFRPPLSRELQWPYVPHVTLADGIDPDRITASTSVLAAYEREVRIDAVHLLEENGGRWRPVAAFPLGPPIVIGRGGQPLEIDVLRTRAGAKATAWRDGRAVGWATVWIHATTAWLSRLETAEGLRREGIASHLLAAVQSWAAGAGADEIEVDPELELDAAATAFLESRGWGMDRPRPGRAL